MDYNAEVERTAASITGPLSPGINRLMVGCLGLNGEAGEVADIVKKAITGGARCRPDLTDEQMNKIADELGDVLWYVVYTAHQLWFTLDDLMERNVAKLRKRHPDGWHVVDGH